MKKQPFVATLCLILIATAFPATGSAKNLKSKLASNKAVKAVSKTREPVRLAVTQSQQALQDRIEAIRQSAAQTAQKVDDIYLKINEFEPLMDAARDASLPAKIIETIDFVNDMQQDFKQFTHQGDCGHGTPCYAFRTDMVQLLNELIKISRDFPQFRLNDGFSRRLSKTADLVQRIPPQFLYLMSKAMGEQLPGLRFSVTQIHKKLSLLPDLPKTRDLYANPLAYEPAMCLLVNDKELATHIATLQAMLKSSAWLLKSISGLLPSDLVVSVTVVGGAGATTTSHPAKMPMDIIAFGIEGIDMKITNYLAISKSMCQMTGHDSP